MFTRKLKKLFEWNQWFIAYNLHNNEGKIDFSKFTPLIPPPDRFWADPFLFNYENGNYIFFEEYDYISTKGHISAFKIEHNGQLISFPKVLNEDFHLAYPQIFAVGEKIYMIPDSRRGVKLYICKRFPDIWKFEKNILDIPCSDSTIFYNGKLFWLFTNIYSSKSGINNKFNIFHSENINGNFIPFEGDVVVNDLFNSRSAGSIFRIGEKIYRPTQENNKNYGEAINLNLITSITAKKYEEKFIGRINPNWMANINRTHTFNHSKTLSVLDARFQRTNWRRLFHWRKIFSQSKIYKKLVKK